jgi:aldehyde:ferredoxin oxidoreductase
MKASSSKPYLGKVLWVDLTKKTFVEESIPDRIYDRFLSGVGLAAYLLYQRIPPDADPMGEENILGFVSGILTGTGSLFTGRWMAVGKSPLTGAWGEANCGGRLSPAIKQCGYDGIFFSGISPEPVYLVVDEDGARLMNGTDLWGMDTINTEHFLLESHSGRHKPAVACIGPAGERKSLISGISHDNGRFAARSGLGAVMGAKCLKAIVLAGSRSLDCADPSGMHELSKRCSRYFKTRFLPIPPSSWLPYAGRLVNKFPLGISMDGIISTWLFMKWGTTSMTQASLEWGDAPVKNWKGSNQDFPVSRSKELGPDKILTREKRKYHCYACPLGCGGICSIGADNRETHKPEYETTMAFGGLLLQTDLDTIFIINDRLNRAGMDTISAGNTIAYAMECYENGIIGKEDTNGIDLTWGDSNAILQLVEKMITRDGFGDLLADGVKRAKERIGNKSVDMAIHAGGQEIAFHDPRLDPGFGLHASVDPLPGNHNTGSQVYYDMFHLWKRVKDLPKIPFLYLKKSKYHSNQFLITKAVAVSCFTQLINAAGLCLFGAYLGVDRLPFFEWLNTALGWNQDPSGYMRIGHRIQTLRQLFNIRQGVDPRSNKLSPRALGIPPLTAGANRNRSVALDEMMSDYWQAIGWDKDTGKPLPVTIQDLDLWDMVEGGGEWHIP